MRKRRLESIMLCLLVIILFISYCLLLIATTPTTTTTPTPTPTTIIIIIVAIIIVTVQELKQQPGGVVLQCGFANFPEVAGHLFGRVAKRLVNRLWPNEVRHISADFRSIFISFPWFSICFRGFSCIF